MKAEKNSFKGIVWATLLGILISISWASSPVLAADATSSGAAAVVKNYQLPVKLDEANQAKVNQALNESVAQVEKDMTAAMEPLIPQFAALVVERNKVMQPEISNLVLTQIKPLVKQFVEDDAKILGPQISALIQQKIMGIQGQIMAMAQGGSDPTSLIISEIKAAINSPEAAKIMQDALDRAKVEQQKDAELIQPQVQAVVQTNMDTLTLEMQKLTKAQLEKSVPEAKKIVDARIDQMITDLRSTLPAEQKDMPEQLRSACEKTMRPEISEQLFEVVAVNVDQKVIAGIKGDTLKSIREIMAPQNKEISNYAVEVGMSLLPGSVDQYGLRPDVENLMRKTTEANLQASEDALMKQIETSFEQQATATNQKMHSFVYDEVNKLLGFATPTTGTVTANPPAAPAIAVNINGQQLNFDVPPIVQQGRTLVPLRAIFQALGAAVTWDQNTQTISASKGNTQISLKPGESVANKNGTKVKLEVPATIVDGRTMVPVRFVSESLGAQVSWDESTRSVNIK